MQENFRAALEWAIQTQQTKSALEMARKLHWFWFARSDYTEARRWFERILTMADVSEYAELHSEVLTQFAHHTGEQTERPKEIRPLVEQALSIARAHADKRNIGRALTILGLILTEERQFAMAQSALEESMQLFQEVNDEWEFARVVMALAKKSYRQDELATSYNLYEQALALFRKIGDRYFQSFAIYWIGVIGAKQGNVKSGKAALREALMLAQQIDSKYAIGSALWRLSEVTQIDGDLASTVRLYWAAKNIWDSVGTLTEDAEIDFENTMTFCRAELGDSAFDKAVQISRSLTIEQAIEYALQME